MRKARSEKLFDRALSEIRRGENAETVLLRMPKSAQDELKAMLAVSTELSSMPLRGVPQPARRRLFAAHTAQKLSRFTLFVRTLRTGYAVTAALAILLIAGTSYAADRSLPGDPLFSLKKSFEVAQIELTARNPEARAALELNLANERLDDAQRVVADDSSSSADKEQAVQELDSQTQVALNQIQQVASSSPSINSSVVQNLESLAKGQASLQAQVNPGGASQNDQQTQQAIAGIQSSIATAANGQSQASLPVAKTFQVSGAVTAITSSSITVDKNQYQLNSKTSYAAADGSTLQFSDFAVGDTVTVVGSTSGENNIAQIVTLKTKPAASTDASAAASDSSALSVPETAPQNQQDVTGGFILDSPVSSGN